MSGKSFCHRVTFFVIVLLSTLLLSGCQNGRDVGSGKITHLSDSNHAQVGDWLFYFQAGELVCEHKTTGEIDSVSRSEAKAEGIDQLGALYSDGISLYYLREYGAYGKDFSEGTTEGFSVICLNVDTFQEKQIYTDLSGKKIYGSSETDFFQHNIKRGFFVRGNDLYAEGDNHLIRIDRITGLAEKLIPFVSGYNYAYDGEIFYCINQDYELVLYTLDTGKAYTIPDVYASYLYVDEEGIYFSNEADNKLLYLWSFGEKRAVKVLDRAVVNIWSDREDIYYVDREDMGLYCVNKTDNSVRKLLDERVWDLYLFDDVPYFYARTDGQQVVKVDK